MRSPDAATRLARRLQRAARIEANPDPMGPRLVAVLDLKQATKIIHEHFDECDRPST